MLAVILAASIAMAGSSDPSTEIQHVSRIDIFTQDTNPQHPDWEAARRGPCTKPYIPWTINAVSGNAVLQMGDMRFDDAIALGHHGKVMMAVRINLIDDFMWTYWEDEYNLRIQTNTPEFDTAGFYMFDHEITNFSIVGLPYSRQTKVEVVFLEVTGTHDSMADHGLTHCVGGELTYGPDVRTCGGTDFMLRPFGWIEIQPFPNAPESPALQIPDEPKDDPAELLRDVFGTPSTPVLAVENPSGMVLK